MESVASSHTQFSPWYSKQWTSTYHTLCVTEHQLQDCHLMAHKEMDDHPLALVAHLCRGTCNVVMQPWLVCMWPKHVHNSRCTGSAALTQNTCSSEHLDYTNLTTNQTRNGNSGVERVNVLIARTCTQLEPWTLKAVAELSGLKEEVKRSELQSHWQ